MGQKQSNGRFRRYFKRGALFVGYPLIVLLVLFVFGFALRFAQTQWSGPEVSVDHLNYKKSYLETITPVQQNSPNIVVIFFDDLGWGDLSSYGNQVIDTPQIDSVARQGLIMTNFYSASPVCTPSRAALLTGRFPPRTRTDRHVYFPNESVIGMGRRMFGLPNDLPKEEITFAEVLQRAGYNTHMIGKWHLGDRKGYRPNDFGFQSWYGVLYSNDMYPLNMYRNDEVVIKDNRKGSRLKAERDEANPLPGNGIDQTELTRKYTDEAISILEKSGDKPFMLYLAHSLPHVPHYPSREFANSSEGGVYGDVIEDLDRSTGAIMAALERLNLTNNTLVIITSDNGADYNGSPGPLRGRKGEILEGGQRVPMIVRWPGKVKAGTRSDQMAMNTDIFPTLLKLTGQNHPEDREIDGKDIMPLFTGLSGSPHDYVYYFPVLDSLPGAIRDDQFKLLWNTGDTGRGRSHFSRLGRDAENHEIRNLFPKRAAGLEKALTVQRQIFKDNPRGWK